MNQNIQGSIEPNLLDALVKSGILPPTYQQAAATTPEAQPQQDSAAYELVSSGTASPNSIPLYKPAGSTVTDEINPYESGVSEQKNASKLQLRRSQASARRAETSSVNEIATVLKSMEQNSGESSRNTSSSLATSSETNSISNIDFNQETFNSGRAPSLSVLGLIAIFAFITAGVVALSTRDYY